MVQEQDSKICGRCGHSWISYAEKPLRCPKCGTYHWEGTPRTNTCAVCGHSWFSRTDSMPIRCPGCKTRSWRKGQTKVHSGYSRREPCPFDTGDVYERYKNGEGCVSISINTDLSLEKVIKIIKAEEGEDRPLRM